MKAITYHRYGPPEVLTFSEVATPLPRANEIRIKVHASTINRTDCGFRSAVYFISRFWSGLFKPKQPILGSEFSGVVDLVGDAVTQFKIGDRVFGYDDEQFGGFGEYLTIDESKAIATLPANFSFDEGAALLEGGHYALMDIKAAKVQEGDQVMVYGATGAIGSAAVQLLKYFGAEVTAVGNTPNLSLLKDLGADHVIDYQKDDFTQCGRHFDFIFDAVGKSSFKACKPLLKKKGVYISTELGERGVNLILPLFTRLVGTKRVLFPIPSINQQDAQFFKELAEKGCFKPVIDKVYPYHEAIQACKYVESGQKTGNVILKMPF